MTSEVLHCERVSSCLSPPTVQPIPIIVCSSVSPCGAVAVEIADYNARSLVCPSAGSMNGLLGSLYTKSVPLQPVS